MPLKDRIVVLDIESAFEAIQALSEKESVDLGFVVVYSGIHSDYGPIHVTIPAAGNACLHLQFASHKAAS